MTETLSHQEHIEVMLDKILQEIKSCEICACHHCLIKLEEWQEKYIQYYQEVYGDYPE